MDEQFAIAESTEDGRHVLRPAGELDLAEVENLRLRLRGLICAEHDTVLDLSGLTFIDSSGIALLYETVQEAQSNGWNLELRDPSRVAYETLRLAGVLKLLGLNS